MGVRTSSSDTLSNKNQLRPKELFGSRKVPWEGGRDSSSDPTTQAGDGGTAPPPWLADFTSCDLTARFDSALGNRATWRRSVGMDGVFLGQSTLIPALVLPPTRGRRRQKRVKAGEGLDVPPPVMMPDTQIPVSAEAQILLRC